MQAILCLTDCDLCIIFCVIGAFVINSGKGCHCDGCLWLITELYDQSQKRSKLNHKKGQIVCATLSDWFFKRYGIYLPHATLTQTVRRVPRSVCSSAAPLKICEWLENLRLGREETGGCRPEGEDGQVYSRFIVYIPYNWCVLGGWICAWKEKISEDTQLTGMMDTIIGE